MKQEAEKRAKKYEEEEKSKCTFSPVLNGSFSKKKQSNHKSLLADNVFDRLATVQDHPQSATKSASPAPVVKVVPRAPKAASAATTDEQTNLQLSSPNSDSNA
jgi:hypothetical protein